MKLKRYLSPIVLLVVLLSQFFPVAGLDLQRAAAVSYCDWAQFVADVTVPDGTTVAPGATFTKTWRLKNIGTCTWSTSYDLVFYNGDPLGATTTVPLTTTVAPGGTIDVSVNMTATAAAGHYRGYWMLQNASNVKFGIGATASSAFWVDIYVSGTASTGYDFAANYCSAAWSSGAGVLPCPGTEGSANGYVVKQDTPKLENGVNAASPGLVVGPQAVAGGYIRGVYPAFTVQAGDRFQSAVGCAYGATSCYVNFRLDYQIGSGPVKTFWSFKERYEGSYYNVNLDLSSLAGQNVTFILYLADISGYGVPSGDKAIWSAPKIVRGSGSVVTPVPTVIPIPTTCDRAQFIADVTVPDGTSFSANAAFTKVWRLKNVGSCTWTTAYQIFFVSGDSLGAPVSVNLPTSVPPGGTVDISVPMTAPALAGHYKGYWMLRNASSTPFGIGSSYNYPFWVEINVTSTSYAAAYDFVTQACSATWKSGAGVLPCPGTDGNANGFVLLPSSPRLEDGSYGLPGLLTFPQNVNNGYIQGVYPAFTVQSGDRFSAIVSCEYGATSCLVNFRLDYQIGSGPVQTFWSFIENFEGQYYNADFSLNPLAGQNVKFILTVMASGPATGDRAIWSAPRIVRSGAIPPGPTPTTGPTATATVVPPPSATPTGVIIGPNADLSVTINDSLDVYTPGGMATYTVVVTNNGPYDVTAASVTVTKPVQITSWTVTCIPDAGATCTAGPVSTAANITDTVDLPIGKKVTYTIASNINASAVGNMVTSVTVTNPAAVPDPNLANNTATDTDTGPSADLAITKTDGLSLWTPGGTATYTVVVMNNGPLNVTGAVFNDNKPAQVTTWSWTCAADIGATCGAGSGGPIATNIADIANIPAGKKVTYTIVATLGTAIPGNLVNTATITNPVGVPDPILSNNTATDTDTGPSADLSVTKTDGIVLYTPGDTVTYTIRVMNNGPQSVLGATFADNMPAQILSWSWTCVPDFSATCTVGPVVLAGNFTDTINLPAGQGVTYTVVANIDPLASGNMVNSASITAPGAIPDPAIGNNVATDTDSPPSADLSISKNDGVTIYPQGGTVTYTIVVTNHGPSDVIGASIYDAIQPQVTSWIWTCAADPGAVCTAGPVAPADFSDLVDIPAGKKITYTVIATIDGAAAGDLVNTVTVTPSLSIPDPILGNNSATDTDAQPSVDLAVTKSDSVTSYAAGGSVIYIITVTNSGPSDVIGATFTDTIPGQVDSWTWSCAPQLGATCTMGLIPGPAVFNDIVNIPSGSSITYTVTAQINIAAVGPMINTATITAPINYIELNAANNSATDIDTNP